MRLCIALACLLTGSDGFCMGSLCFPAKSSSSAPALNLTATAAPSSSSSSSSGIMGIVMSYFGKMNGASCDSPECCMETTCRAIGENIPGMKNVLTGCGTGQTCKKFDDLQNTKSFVGVCVCAVGEKCQSNICTGAPKFASTSPPPAFMGSWLTGASVDISGSSRTLVSLLGLAAFTMATCGVVIWRRARTRIVEDTCSFEQIQLVDEAVESGKDLD